MSVTKSRHQFVLGLERALYGRRGEPYRIAGHTLRYMPGTRPVRPRYIHFADDALRAMTRFRSSYSALASSKETLPSILAHIMACTAF